MHPIQSQLIARERRKDMLTAAERRRLAHSDLRAPRPGRAWTPSAAFAGTPDPNDRNPAAEVCHVPAPAPMPAS